MNRESHTCVRISHVASNFVMFLNNNETEIPEDQFEVYVVKLDAKDFCMPIKGQSKTTVTRICRLFNMNSFVRDFGLMLVQGNIHSSILKYQSKGCIFFVNHNMCIETKTERFNAWQEEVRENTKSRQRGVRRLHNPFSSRT